MREILTVLEADARATPERIAGSPGSRRTRSARRSRRGRPRASSAGTRRWSTGTASATSASPRSSTSPSPPSAGRGFDDVAERIARFREIRAVHLCRGAQDLRVEVEGASMKEVADFVAQKPLGRRPGHGDEHPLPAAPLQGRRPAAHRPRARPAAVGDALMGPPQKPLSRVVEASRPRASGSSSTSPRRCPASSPSGVGEPDFPTPWGVREAAIHALERGATTYTGNSGLLELRELICADLDDALRHDLPARRRVPDHLRRLRGSRPGAARAAQPRRRGDRPRALLRRLPAVRGVRGRRARAGRDATRRRATGSTPSGSPRRSPRGPRRCCSARRPTPPAPPSRRRDLAALAALAEREDFWLVCDEIYDRLTYTGTHTSTAAAPGAWDRTVVLDGFSKSYAMTGWRVGLRLRARARSRR